MICRTTLMSAVALLSVVLTLDAQTAEINDKRAKFHYQLHCQGCHTDDGRGFQSVPQMKGYIGNFLKTEEGREYLVRVPGSANAYLNDEELAEVLNWMIKEFSEDSIPEKWQPYTSAEISSYRKRPLLEVDEYRKGLVVQIENLPGASK